MTRDNMDNEAAVFNFLNEGGRQPILIYEPNMTPFFPMAMKDESSFVVRNPWDLAPCHLLATQVFYMPWQCDVFEIMRSLSTTIEIRLRGIPVRQPFVPLIRAAIDTLNLPGAEEMNSQSLFDEVHDMYPEKQDICFYENSIPLSPSGTRAKVAQHRIFQMLAKFVGIPWDDFDSMMDAMGGGLLQRAVFKFRTGVLASERFVFSPRENDTTVANVPFRDDTKQLFYVGPDCAFVWVGANFFRFYDKNPSAQDRIVFWRDKDVDPDDPTAGEPLLRCRFLQLTHSLFKAAAEATDPGALHLLEGHNLAIRKRIATAIEDADQVFDRLVAPPEEAAAVACSDNVSDTDTSDDEPEDEAAMDDAIARAGAAFIASTRPPRWIEMANNKSVYTTQPIDVCMDEFVDLCRLQDALRWRHLTRHDALILQMFEKQDGRHHVNYAPPDKDDQPSKKAKKEEKPPTGLRFLTPGVRQFVLQAGTVCIDAPDWIQGTKSVFEKRAEICQSICLFFDRGAHAGLVPVGVKLVSTVPEGFLVRGFLHEPPTEFMLDTCRSIVKHDTGCDIGELRVIDLTPKAGTSHPLAGDFKLWEPASISPFAAPLFRAMRKVIENKPHCRAFNWFYDTEGNLGKTVHAKYYAERGACCVSAQTPSNIFFAIKDHVHKSGTLRVLIVDVPRDMTGVNENFAGAIESIKDGLIFSGKYESGTVKLPSPTVIIFANAPMPAAFKYALSPDRWREVNLRETPVHVSDRFILSATDNPGVYTDLDNYVPLETLPRTTRESVALNC
jgi:hypothetical protein